MIKSYRILCSDEMTVGGLLNSFRMGADDQKDQAILGTLSLTSVEVREIGE